MMWHPKESNFFYLLVGLLFVLVLAPLGVARLDGVVGIAFTGTLIVGVWSLARARWAYISGLVLAVASLILTGAEIGIERVNLRITGLVVVFLFCLLSLWIALREVLFSRTIDANRIAGAVCVYLLIGMTWSFLYQFVELFNPDALSGHSANPDERFLDLVYFSFVTLTTLGYGDFQPVSPFARALTYLEAVTGVMYVAILVASLVGSFARKK